MSDLKSIFGGFITDHLNADVPIPEHFKQITDNAVFSLLDSEILIEDNFSIRANLTEPKVKQPLESFAQTFVIDELTEQVKHTGFGAHFHQIIGLFGSIMLELTANETQLAQVNAWLEQGYFGHFLMTDSGGPSLNQWQTSLDTSADNWQLNIDKKWGIEAHNLGFIILVVRQPGKPFPLTFLIPPEQAKSLHQEKIGASYLDNLLQLGNAKGEIIVNRDQLLKKGGLGSVNRFLTLVRPRFVKSLMNHLLWLAANNRLTLDPKLNENINYLNAVADSCLAQTHFSMHSVDRVLALKFASNELLLNTVSQGKVAQFNDQRDLLGFTKMEGSSYRCFLEIYSKQKRVRR
ncbi:hypothetical protein [Pseudoalteromonas denitrificans]|uniref:Acyl-CoA dehydrogenase n=1 Tax=Pseudoalteromonas denitrificans DSM 6059 TaxID=1123010 RepID=A0A1I1I6V7_9GAMM|nr:hypothetical protein [Pseudoalteromonas denitrificans]SFC32027.1 hypothetical protein SAMN02745724_01410 [Pseudoalteromonas denitrificans DSM 6059]